MLLRQESPQRRQPVEQSLDVIIRFPTRKYFERSQSYCDFGLVVRVREFLGVLLVQAFR